jgi:hypothetical protein
MKKEKKVHRTVVSENKKLLTHIEERMELIHQGLKSLYLGSDEITMNTIHGLRKNIYYLKYIFLDLLLDEWPAKKILEERELPI